MDIVLSLIDNFWKAYGDSLIMLIIQGVLVALFVEYIIKQLFNSMIKKATSDVKIAKLENLKSVVCTVAAAVLSVVLAICVIVSMPLPGGVFLCPTWVGIVYFVQFGVSLFVIKKIQKAEHEKKAKTKKEEKRKYSVTVGEGEKIYKELPDGSRVEVK